MAASREVIEGTQIQGVDESVRYTVAVDPAPVSILAVTVHDVSAEGADVTLTTMPSGTASFAGAVITLPNLLGLTVRHQYRVEVQYTDGINVLEPYFRVNCDS